MTNTALWDSVFQTDPAHTKNFTRAGGFSGTAIKPLYLIHKATELWGSMGDKWKVIESERVIHGNAVYIKAKLIYPVLGGFAEVEHWGGDVLTKGEKAIPNDEAFKMALTDATGKCLSVLGFSADVHMGMFDGNKYVAPEKPDPKKETAASRNKRFKSVLESIQNSEDPAIAWSENLSEIQGFQAEDQTFYDELVKAGKLRKEQLAQEEMMKQQLEGAR